MTLDAEDTDGVESYHDIASIGDIGESSDMSSPGTPDIPPSPLHTRSSGKAKKTKDKEPFYKGYGIVYPPGDTNGLTKKLHLLTAEFFAGNTTVRNELVHVLDALLRLKQLTRTLISPLFSSIIMIVYKSRRFAMRRYRYGGSGIASTNVSLLARYATKAMLQRRQCEVHQMQPRSGKG